MPEIKKATNRYIKNPNDNSSKYRKSCQAGVMSLPELGRVTLSRDQTASNYRVNENPYHEMNRPTERVRLDRSISIEHLNRNLYKLMKGRSLSDIGSTCSDSRQVNQPCISITNGHVGQTLVPSE